MVILRPSFFDNVSNEIKLVPRRRSVIYSVVCQNSTSQADGGGPTLVFGYCTLHKVLKKCVFLKKKYKHGLKNCIRNWLWLPIT